MNVVEMVMARAFSNSDPNTQMARDYLKSETEKTKAELIERKAETIENITAKLAKAEADNAPASVIDAYNKLLLEATGR